MARPKIIEVKCVRCDWEGRKEKAYKQKFPGMTFLMCPKCHGKIEETEEFKQKVKENMEKYYPVK
jgi:uncharacterized C2H2 Zn-finger protein